MAAPRIRKRVRGALAATLAATAALLTACGEESGNAEAPNSPVEVADIRGEADLDDAYRGVLDSVVHEDLDAYEGIEMTLLAEVVDVVSPRVFTVTSPEEEDVEPTLVVTTADAGEEPAAGDQVVLAVTPVEGFDAEIVVDELGLDVAPGDLDDLADDLFLVAEIVEPAP